VFTKSLESTIKEHFSFQFRANRLLFLEANDVNPLQCAPSVFWGSIQAYQEATLFSFSFIHLCPLGRGVHNTTRGHTHTWNDPLEEAATYSLYTLQCTEVLCYILLEDQ